MKNTSIILVLLLSFSSILNAQVKPMKPIGRTIPNLINTNSDSRQNLFLKIDMIDGDSTDETHRNWIELQSFHFDNELINNNESLYSLSFSKSLDISSVDLAMHANTKKHIPKVELEITQIINGNQVPVFNYEFENIFIELYSMKKNPSENLIENIKLLAEKVKITYYEYDNLGNLKSKFDRILKTN